MNAKAKIIGREPLGYTVKLLTGPHKTETWLLVVGDAVRHIGDVLPVQYEPDDQFVHAIHVPDLRALCEELLFCLNESHDQEVQNDHFGDDDCSYCRVIAKARDVLGETGEVYDA